jgi:fructokinase
MRVEQAARPVIAGIGEVLWDVLEDSEELGGAPINFAYHAGVLGAEAYAISCVGDDGRGAAALKALAERSVSTECITVLPGATTGYVFAQVDAQGVASYTFPDDVAWDRLVIGDAAEKLAQRLDAACFGSLAQRSPVSRKAILDYLTRLGPTTLKVFDLNIRHNFYGREILETSLEMADVVKLNDEEIALLGRMFGLAGDQEARLGRLVERFSLRLGVLTRGGRGSLLISPDGVSDHPGYPTKSVDTIGAGDSFTAATVLGFLQGYSLDRINEHANRVAAYVCSCQGAMPRLPQAIRSIDPTPVVD